MGVEIERKFLLAGEGWRDRVASSSRLRQGYLSTRPAVRVRLVDDEQGYLTVKGSRVGDRRSEFEYAIPADDARFMLDHLCLWPQIEKTRHHLDITPGQWTVDVFAAENAGLVLLEAEGEEIAALPDWAGEDVTEDDRYANSSLIERPFGDWERRHG
jgi:adenylate cyclase